ncbi:cytochrome P450 4A21 [Apiospora kogelbergensis]|uniref:cytochrome P450 4A21 n=1 Tax=Apiospora kogelbergensis TaxID=1337665 RepID=UPI003130D78F
MMLFSPTLTGCVLLALAASYIWVCLTSPLRKVPGPWSSLFTSWILKWHEFRAGRTRYVHRLHLRYGPVVRVAPNEVVFASAEGVKEVYGSGGSGYDKTEFYDLFQVYGRRTMFSTRNKQDHAKRKRVLADRYANTNVMRSASLEGIRERSKRFVDRCSKSLGGSIDLFHLVSGLHDYAFDCVSHHLFHPYGSDSLRDEEDEKIMRQVAFDDSLQNRLFSYYNPALHGLVKNVLALFSKPRETPLADNLVLSATSKSDPPRFHSASPDAGQDLRFGATRHGCGMHRPYGCWYRYDWRKKSARLTPTRPSTSCRTWTPWSWKDCAASPPFPCHCRGTSQQAAAPSTATISPGGTIVSCQAYSTHRIDQRVFPEPERFHPERWLEEAGDLDRKRLFFAFASGGRGCIGKHLALAEMKTLLIDVYSRYSTRPDEAVMTDGDMEMSDQLISSQPRGQKCWMILAPLEESL